MTPEEELSARVQRIQHTLIDLLAFTEHDPHAGGEVMLALTQDLNRAGAFIVHIDPEHGYGVECIALLHAVTVVLYKMMEILRQKTVYTDDDVRAWLRENAW